MAFTIRGVAESTYMLPTLKVLSNLAVIAIGALAGAVLGYAFFGIRAIWLVATS